jgi:hypothetical protein
MPVTSFSVRVPLDRTGATLSKGTVAFGAAAVAVWDPV